MPLHDFRCPQGHQFEVFQPLTQLRAEEPCPVCASSGSKIFLRPPMATPDLQGYTSPIDGRWVEGRVARREDLRRNDCVEWEPGFREECSRRRNAAEREFDRSLEHTIDAEIAAMPARKREKLEAEATGAEINVVRTTPAS